MASSIIAPAAASAQQPDRSLQLACIAARIAEENRGRDVVVLDMRGQTSIFDYFVLATGTSRRQLHAISDEIELGVLNMLGDHLLHGEGYAEGRWICLDYGDVVVHLFDDESRDYYGLEQLWCRARRVPWGEPTAPSSTVV